MTFLVKPGGWPTILSMIIPFSMAIHYGFQQHPEWTIWVKKYKGWIAAVLIIAVLIYLTLTHN